MNNRGVLLSTGSNIRVELDPCNHYPDVKDQDLLETTGLLFGWAHEYAASSPDSNLKDYMGDAYGYGMRPMEGGEITEDGRYVYPEDPDLHPFVKVCVGDEWFYMYPYSIVHFSDGTTTRMD